MTHRLAFINKFYCFLQKIRILKGEYNAIRSLFHRSGLSYRQQAILERSFHTSRVQRQQQNGDKNKKNENENEKMSSLVAKAFLWMLTAYLIVSTISLIFPNSNHPEVSKTKILLF